MIEIQEKGFATQVTLLCRRQEQQVHCMFNLWTEKREKNNWMGY
jgi:hypothetical protein